MQYALLSSFFAGFLYTLMFFALSFVSVLFVRLCVYYIKTNAPKTPVKPAEEKPEPVKEKPAPAPAKKPVRERRRVHNIEIRPDEINRIYVADRR